MQCNIYKGKYLHRTFMVRFQHSKIKTELLTNACYSGIALAIDRTRKALEINPLVPVFQVKA